MQASFLSLISLLDCSLLPLEMVLVDGWYQEEKVLAIVIISKQQKYTNLMELGQLDQTYQQSFIAIVRYKLEQRYLSLEEDQLTIHLLQPFFLRIADGKKGKE